MNKTIILDQVVYEPIKIVNGISTAFNSSEDENIDIIFNKIENELKDSSKKKILFYNVYI